MEDYKMLPIKIDLLKSKEFFNALMILRKQTQACADCKMNGNHSINII